MTEQWIYWTDELKSSYNDLVGKKCANLGELAEIGVNTPPGFALTVQACEHFMEKSGAAEEIRSFVQKYGHDLKDDVEKQSQASYYIRSIIESKKIPSDLEKQIETAYRDLCQKCQVTDLAVAVRSSGAVSMPGQMETFLNVKGSESLLQYIVRVWGSAFTTRALTFRLDNNMAIESAPIGVAVLKMVNAKCAGITLTVLPSTGDTSKILIEANWGLGESVVSGEITPDQFVIDKKSREIERHIYKKPQMVTFNSSGIQTQDVPVERQNLPCLEEDEILENVRIAIQIESHFSEPQDLEWVIDSDLSFPENIYWVQARPAKYFHTTKDTSEYLADLMTDIFKM